MRKPMITSTKSWITKLSDDALYDLYCAKVDRANKDGADEEFKAIVREIDYRAARGN